MNLFESDSARFIFCHDPSPALPTQHCNPSTISTFCRLDDEHNVQEHEQHHVNGTDSCAAIAPMESNSEAQFVSRTATTNDETAAASRVTVRSSRKTTPPLYARFPVVVDRFNACMPCRQRKIRCVPAVAATTTDTNGDACATCIRRGKPCHWPVASEKIRPQIKRQATVDAAAWGGSTSATSLLLAGEQVRSRSSGRRNSKSNGATKSRKRAFTHEGHAIQITTSVKPPTTVSPGHASSFQVVKHDATLDVDADGELEPGFLAPELDPRGQFDVSNVTTKMMSVDDSSTDAHHGFSSFFDVPQPSNTLKHSSNPETRLISPRSSYDECPSSHSMYTTWQSIDGLPSRSPCETSNKDDPSAASNGLHSFGRPISLPSGQSILTSSNVNINSQTTLQSCSSTSPPPLSATSTTFATPLSTPTPNDLYTGFALTNNHCDQRENEKSTASLLHPSIAGVTAQHHYALTSGLSRSCTISSVASSSSSSSSSSSTMSQESTAIAATTLNHLPVYDYLQSEANAAKYAVATMMTTDTLPTYSSAVNSNIIGGSSYDTIDWSNSDFIPSSSFL